MGKGLDSRKRNRGMGNAMALRNAEIISLRAILGAVLSHLSHYSFTHDDECPGLYKRRKCTCEADGDNEAQQRLEALIRSALTDKKALKP